MMMMMVELILLMMLIYANELMMMMVIMMTMNDLLLLLLIAISKKKLKLSKLTNQKPIFKFYSFYISLFIIQFTLHQIYKIMSKLLKQLKCTRLKKGLR